jgi:hypothetical protein
MSAIVAIADALADFFKLRPFHVGDRGDRRSL